MEKDKKNILTHYSLTTSKFNDVTTLQVPVPCRFQHLNDIMKLYISGQMSVSHHGGLGLISVYFM